MTAGERFRILCVCTGNVFRSVAAEGLIRQGLRDRLGNRATAFAVASAGTRAVTGASMHPLVLQALTATGGAGAGFVSRQLTRELLSEADLVLVAAGTERDTAVSLEPRALRRTFLVREFGRLAGHVRVMPPEPLRDPVAWARAVVADAAALRGRVPYVDPADDDIPDPAGRPEAWPACLATISEALRDTVDTLAGLPPSCGWRSLR